MKLKKHILYGYMFLGLQFLVPGAILFALLQFIPSQSTWQDDRAELSSASVGAGKIENLVKEEIREIFFGKEVSAQSVENIVESKMSLVSSRRAFSASLAVIKKHEKTIRILAKKYGVPEDVAFGIGLLENGGSETAKSPAGALGVFQLMPGTARSLGLKVNAKVDERRNPVKNIDAGMRYLALNYYRFGDWGLATWAYHAGEGNVAKAIQIYARANHRISLPGVGNPQKIRAYADKYGLTIHELLSDPEVKKFTRRLNDDSSGYPYKVLATARLFNESR